ncbi:MAG: hypothetical protein AB6733_14140 [Clostridiaceae bacterium]
MLILDAEIRHDLPDENKYALPHDLSTDIILRPAINFGDNFLFSGQLIADKSIKVLVRGVSYRLLIEMPTIDSEAYEWIKDYVKIGNIFLIQTGGRVLGKGKIIDFIYEP